MGRAEIAKEFARRKLNEWLLFGGKKVILIDPFEFAFMSDIPEFSNIEPTLFMDVLPNLPLSSSEDIIIYEPFETPIILFPKYLREKAISLANSIILKIKSFGLKPRLELYGGSPLCYEQLFLVDPIFAVTSLMNFVKNNESKTIITLRPLTALVLRLAQYFAETTTKIFDYAYWLSLGA